jgi:hypothetical protein
MIRDEFLGEIEAFLSAHRINATHFGRLVMNDSSFVHRIRAGGDVRLSTMQKVIEFMRSPQPELPLQAAE